MYESLPPVLECRTVVTVHDSAYKRRPDSLRPEWVQRLGRQIPEAIGRADLVITVSRFTKGDLEEMLGVPEEKIRVIYHGANSAFFRIASEPVEASESVRMAYGIRRPYILYVGVLQPSKNIGGLVEAFARLKARIDIPHRLVIVGARGWMYEDIFVKMQESGVEDVVDFPGEVHIGAPTCSSSLRSMRASASRSLKLWPAGRRW